MQWRRLWTHFKFYEVCSRWNEISPRTDIVHRITGRQLIRDMMSVVSKLVREETDNFDHCLQSMLRGRRSCIMLIFSLTILKYYFNEQQIALCESY